MTESFLQATIDSRFDNVWLLGVTVKAVAVQAGFSSVESAELELAIVEALNNSIEHSYGGASGNTVEFSLRCGKGALEFTIADQGQPVPPLRQGDPASDDQDQLSEGGRGIAIIRQVMDSVN